jgi:hypothetical protein
LQNGEKRPLSSSCPSVRLSTRLEELGPHWKDFNETWYVNIFENTLIKLKLHQNPTRTTSTLREEQCTFLWYLAHGSAESEAFQTNVVEKIKTHILV